MNKFEAIGRIRSANKYLYKHWDSYEGDVQGAVMDMLTELFEDVEDSDTLGDEMEALACLVENITRVREEEEEEE